VPFGIRKKLSGETAPRVGMAQATPCRYERWPKSGKNILDYLPGTFDIDAAGDIGAAGSGTKMAQLAPSNGECR
jgi:hypothetical protein